MQDIGELNVDPDHIKNHISDIDITLLNNWETLLNKQYARKNYNALNTLSKITSSQVKQQIVLFSDDNATTSTLKRFLTDLKNTTGFITFMNKTENLEFAKAFVGHKQTPACSAKDYEVVTDGEILKVNAPISSTLQDKIKEWLKYTYDVTVRQDYFTKGKDFETYVSNLLKNYSQIPGANPESQTLSEDIRNKAAIIFTAGSQGSSPNNYRVLTQVQFCLPNKSCNDARGYFTADLVFFKYDNNNNIVDIIFADTKLSPGTELTSNQRDAKNAIASPANNFIMRSDTRFTDYLGVDLPSGKELKKGETYTVSKFFEIHGNGNGTYSPGGIIK